MTGIPPWHEGLAPVTAELNVATGVHRVSWLGGNFVLDDHPDPDAELALAALGGARCTCLDVFDAWVAQADDPEVLTLGRRALADQVRGDRAALARLEREAARWTAQWAAAADDLRVTGDVAGSSRLADVAARAERRLRVRVGFVRLLGLDPDLVDRLQLTVLAAAERRWVVDPHFRDRHRARLSAALAARALPGLRRAGLAPADPMQIELLPPGEAAVVERHGRVALPLSWLTNVWGRGVDVVDGRFVVQVRAVHDGGKVLELVGVDGHDWRVERT
ncbi:MAG TPA: hypothetical protein VFV35_00815 [Acidimicrobiales bacterium]|nr:hypothetical protein [Acidimicrobiales bacterium]